MSQPTILPLQDICASLDVELSHVENVHGGSISSAFRLVFVDGRSVFVKYNGNVPGDFFAAEAAGLSALATRDTLRTPEVLNYSNTCIVLEFIESTTASKDFWSSLGCGLANLHVQPAASFGFAHNNYCGSSLQPNLQTPDGHAFFAEQRLLYQAQLAYASKKLEKNDLQNLEKLVARLHELIPQQDPCLIHGDLWSGNVIADEQGDPVLIDPAVYWGWAEADIAMTLLFGGFDPQFYRAYQAAAPMPPGWRERVPLYNLYHLLNHLNLFGPAYLQKVRDILNKFK